MIVFSGYLECTETLQFTDEKGDRMMYASMKRVMSILLSLAMLNLYSLPAWSGVVSTDQLIEQEIEVFDRDRLVSMMDRADVREQLVAHGVDPEFARQRIAALSDMQVEQLNAEMDQLPAGSGVVGILVAVLLVLIILDIIGVTNIFSFIHSPGHH